MFCNPMTPISLKPNDDLIEKLFRTNKSPAPASSHKMSILEESPLAQTDIASTTERLCKVCNEKESKYKCPRCYLP